MAARNDGICAFGHRRQQRARCPAARRPRAAPAAPSRARRRPARTAAPRRAAAPPRRAGVQRVRQAHRAGIADDDAAGRARRGQRAGHVVAQRPRRGLPVVGRDAVGHDVQLAQVEPARGHVRRAPWAASTPRRRHRGRPRPRPPAPATKGCQRDMPDSSIGDSGHRSCTSYTSVGAGARARDAPRHPDVHRVGAGGDHDVGLNSRSAAACRAHTAQEGPDVAHAAEAVAVVGRRRQPAVVDAVDGLRSPGLAAGARAHASTSAASDLHPMALRAPIRAPGSRAGTPCPARAAGVVVDEQDVHARLQLARGAPRSACTPGPKSACARTQARLSRGDVRRPRQHGLQRPAPTASSPSARIRPLSPSRTSSRLAGRSDRIGMQPWAIASSTDTETESLRGRLRYQCARRTSRPASAASSRPRSSPDPAGRPSDRRLQLGAQRAVVGHHQPRLGHSRAMEAKIFSTRSGA